MECEAATTGIASLKHFINVLSKKSSLTYNLLVGVKLEGHPKQAELFIF